MLRRSRATKLVKFVLPFSALSIIALLVTLGLILARPSAAAAVVEIDLVPGQAPLAGPPGSIFDFTARVVLNGEEVTAVRISMTFPPDSLQVVDANGNLATSITPNPASPFHPGQVGSFTVENTVDNTNGTIRFLAGSTNAASANFDLADFRLQVKADAPVEGPPTPIVFLVNGSAETSAARSGQELLANPTDFTGASISVTNRVVQIVMVPDSLQVPIARSPGSTVDFTVRVILNGVEATAVQLDMTFDPQLLQVVDGAGNPAAQVTPNAASPFNPNNVGSFTIKNSVDNTNGTISFLAGNASPASTSFDLVDIRIKAGDVLTPRG